MKHDLSTLRKVIEKSLGKTISATTDMEKVVLSFSKHQITLSGKILKQLWSHIKGAEKLSPDTLNKLALLAGFQNWSDFQKALHGESDAEINYEDHTEYPTPPSKD